jgi:hypothetical protein
MNMIINEWAISKFSFGILFSRIKLQTPVWRWSGYPDKMIGGTILE